MKKALIIAALLAMATPALAFSIGNLKFRCPKSLPWCGGDHNKRQVIEQKDPNTPVSIPEPATLILLGSGLVALAFTKKQK